MIEGGTRVREIWCRTERFEHRCGRGEEAVRARSGACGRGQPAEFEVAEAGLITFAEQVEHADALAEVVVRVGGTPGRRMEASTKAQEFPPGAGHRAGLHAR